MIQLLLYIIGTITKPTKTFNKLLNDPDKMKYSWGVIALLESFFIITTYGFHVTKFHSWIPFFIKIPDESYYFWEIFFLAPLSISFLIMAVGIALLLIPSNNEKNSFYALFITMSFAVSVPFFINAFYSIVLVLLLIFDLINIENTLVHLITKIVDITCYILALSFTMILIPISISVSQKIKISKSILAGVISNLTFWVMMAIFVR